MAILFRRPGLRPLLLIVLAVFLAACAGRTAPPASDQTLGKLQVVATTTLVGDVVHAVGGDDIALTVLLPPGAEPHSFQPSPQDMAGLARADLVFVNGFNLEESLMPILNGAVADKKIVAVSDGITPIAASEAGSEHGIDPHTWTDPNNVMVWTDNIASALAGADPQHAEAFSTRAAAYKRDLAGLDAWIREQVVQIPAGNRKLVTDHAVFGYFAQRYGLEQVGAVVPGFSALAEPSAKELAGLEDAIRTLGVKAVFVGNTVNPTLAERVANDTHTRLLFVFTDSLSDASGPAATYLDFMRRNVSVFVDGLR